MYKSQPREEAMRERKLALRPSEARKDTQVETINKSTEETYEKHFVSLSGPVRIYSI